MITTIKCPVCGRSAKREYYDEVVGTVEDHINCDHCGYTYEFVYGNYVEVVNDKEFIWGYTLYRNYSQMYRLFKKISKEMFMARRNWRKGIAKRKIKRKDEVN